LRGLEGAPLDAEVAGRRFQPTLYLYDNYPGGIGLAAPLFESRTDLVRRARALVADCPCSGGCPGCVGPVLGVRDGLSVKQAAPIVLDLLDDPDSSVENGHGPP
ncbi:MAG: Zn-binding domain-containing protein, partial [Thiobacillaceae bacterium]